MKNRELLAGIISGAVAVTAGLYFSSGKILLQKTLADAEDDNISLPDKLNNLFNNLVDNFLDNKREEFVNRKPDSPTPGLNVFSEPGLLL